MIHFNETVNSCYESILDSIQYELRGIDKNESKEIYFHDIVSQEVDNSISYQTRSENMKVIDDTNNEEYADEGLIDNSSLDRMIQTMAYCCLEQELFNDDFMQELQTKLNNETILYEQVQDLLIKIIGKQRRIKKGNWD